MRGRERIRGSARRLLDLLGRVRLTTIFALVVVLTFLVWVVSVIIAARVSGDTVKEEYIEDNYALFTQMHADVERGIQDLSQLSYTLMSDPNINAFLSAGNFSERQEALRDVEHEFNRLGTIHTHLQGIKVYNREGIMLASSGNNIPFDLMKVVSPARSLKFAGPFVTDNKAWFAVLMPLYSVSDGKIGSQNGYCCLQMDMAFIRERIPGSLQSSQEWCTILNEKGEELIATGEKPAALEGVSLSSFQEGQDDNALLYVRGIGRTTWRMVFFAPGSSAGESINRLQRIYILTCIFTGILILFLFVGIYASFLRPVDRQIRFMNYYAVNRRSRMEVRSHNEMGVLAENLNAMLDDIDRLNEEKLAAGRKALEAEYQKKQSELLAYRSQINPHFLYNTFECIRGMALYYEVPDIAEISEALGRFFAYNVRGKGYASFREIEEHINDYALIIGYRFLNRYRFICRIAEEARDCVFPKMVLQPLLENAIFHGLEPADREGTVEINVGKEGNLIRVAVSDDGVGMSKEEHEALMARLGEYDRTNLVPVEKHGIGMINLYRRLRVFYGEKMSFTIESEKDAGTKTTILVPEEPEITGEEYVPGFLN